MHIKNRWINRRKNNSSKSIRNKEKILILKKIGLDDVGVVIFVFVKVMTSYL